MKTVLAVFSATGNTLRIAKEIKDAEIHFVEEYLNGDIILDQDTERLGAEAAKRLIALINKEITGDMAPVSVKGSLLEGASVKDLNR